MSHGGCGIEKRVKRKGEEGKRKGRDNTETQRKRREDAEEGHTFIGEFCKTLRSSGDFEVAFQSGEDDVG
jgi:hypothetical protein